MGTVIQHKGLGLKFNLPEKLVQSDIEIYQDNLLSFFDEDQDNISTAVLSNGVVVKSSVRCGWLGKLTEDNVDTMKPNKVRWLSGKIFEWQNRFLLSDKDLDIIFAKEYKDLSKEQVALREHYSCVLEEYRLPELLQRDVENFDKKKAQRNSTILSLASLRGAIVRIANELKWVDVGNVGDLDPKLVQVLFVHINNHIDESLSIPLE